MTQTKTKTLALLAMVGAIGTTIGTLSIQHVFGCVGFRCPPGQNDNSQDINPATQVNNVQQSNICVNTPNNCENLQHNQP